MTIYAATDDSLFPYREINQVFEGTELEVKKVAGTHLNRATPKGCEQLHKILEDLLQ